MASDCIPHEFRCFAFRLTSIEAYQSKQEEISILRILFSAGSEHLWLKIAQLPQMGETPTTPHLVYRLCVWLIPRMI